jgi:hypothetical protein
MTGLFPLEKQRQDKWCWAAVSVSVDHYFSPRSNLTQCLIAQKVLNNGPCCSGQEGCNRAARLQAALSVVGKLKTIVTRPLQFDEVRREINANRPVCVRIAWSGGGAHFVIIRGYRQSASGLQLVEVADPLFPSSTVLYDVLVSGYQNPENPDDGGRWTASFLVGE